MNQSRRMITATLAAVGLMIGGANASAAEKDIVDTAVSAGQFKTLAAALAAADLVSTLKGAGPFTVFAPYLDHELFDFLASLPTQLIMDHNFHTETIHLAYPAWNQIRFEDKQVPEPDFHKQYAEFARRIGEEVGFWPRSDWLRTPMLSLRLLRSRLSETFAGSSDWYFRPALWLLQLESLVRSAGGRRTAVAEASY